MKITSYRVFEGRNIYSHKKCLRLDLDLQGYSETPSKDIANFNQRLVESIPELYTHRCGIYEEGGFVKRLAEGTYLAHICEHMIIALQNRLGIDVAYGKAREISGDMYYDIIQYEYKKTVIEIAKLAVNFINALCGDRDFNLEEKFNDIKAIYNEEVMGPSTMAIVNAAKSKEIPITSMWDSGFYMLGYGKYSKLVEATVVEDTRCPYVDLACDKVMTKKILQNQCIPVATGGIVNTLLEALIQAESITYPVVLKPRYGNHGNGVKVNIKNQKELTDAFTEIRKDYSEIIIEKYYTGKDFRICMIDGKMVAASLRLPPSVVGDGKKTLKELIGILNMDPKRGEEHEKPLTKVKLNDSLTNTISRQGFKLHSIIPKGEIVYLRENANLSTGGIAIDYTDRVCKENIEIFERVAASLNLNICGIDVCHEDLATPLQDKGIIMEVNAGPGIRMHHYPYEGSSRPVGEAIVNMMFKNSPKSIPIVAVTGTNGKTTTTRIIGHTLSCMGYNVGMTTTSGIYIKDKCIHKGDDTGYESAKTVLMNKEVEVAVLETARGGIIRNGLCYDLADVGIITNISEDHLGLDGINTIQDLANVKSLVVEAVKKDGYSVINGDDPVSLDVLNRVKGNPIIFSKDKDNPYLRDNINQGGYGVYINDKSIYVEKNKKIFYVADIDEIPITLNGALDYNIENALAACSALVGLGVDYCTIAKGLKSFKCDEESNPGRFNVFEVNGGKVVLDYGHNIEGYKAVIRGLKRLPHNKLIGVIGVPGDRMNSNVEEVGRISGNFFDYIVIKEDKEKRGRMTGEIADILKKGIDESSINSENVITILDEVSALKVALDMMNPGDIVVVFFENFDGVRTLIKNYTKMEYMNDMPKLG